MTRVPGTFDRKQDWTLVPNPELAGKEPRLLTAACHDRTPFLTAVCRCGAAMHLHESQLAELPPEAEVAANCKGCGELLVFPPGWFAAGFAEMRAAGWIA
jgi:hypothetical protein